jgi:hypothetical protein
MDLRKWTDWYLISKDTYKIILDQAEKNLNETTKTGEILTTRSTSLIQFFVTISLGLVSYLTTFLANQTPLKDPKFYLTIFGLVVSFIIVFKAILVYKMYRIRPNGNTPTGLLDEYKHDTYQHYQESYFLYRSILTVEKSIGENNLQNTVRSNHLKDIISIVKWSLVIAACYTLLVLFATFI